MLVLATYVLVILFFLESWFRLRETPKIRTISARNSILEQFLSDHVSDRLPWIANSRAEITEEKFKFKPEKSVCKKKAKSENQNVKTYKKIRKKKNKQKNRM